MRVSSAGMSGKSLLRGARILIAAALLATAHTPSARGQLRSETPQLIKVNERVYCATGYSLGNVNYVVTDTSLVVIDTSESPLVAKATLEAMRAISDKPVSYLIYTHFHGDHCNGAKAFEKDKPRIIAQALHVPEMTKYRQTSSYNQRLNGLQFGASLPDSQKGVKLAAEALKPVVGYLPPTITFDEQFRFEEGGVKFEIYHAPGETIDQSFVWLPESRTLFAADLFYNSFPMVASPMKHDRPMMTWVQSLERMQAMEPEYLVPSHGNPVEGASEIHEMLGNYAAAVRYVHDQTLRGLNRGQTLDELRRSIQLPEKLAHLPYLQPLYGKVAWAVNGAWRQYTGWYDMNPVHLNPGPPAETHRAIVEAAGGAAKLVERADKALADKQYQLAVELCEIVLTVAPEEPRAREIARDAFQALGDESVNGVEQNIYRAAALRLAKPLADAKVEAGAR